MIKKPILIWALAGSNQTFASFVVEASTPMQNASFETA